MDSKCELHSQNVVLVDQLLVALINSKFNSYIISQKLTNHIDGNLKIINELYHQYDRELKIMKIEDGKYIK